MCIELNEVLFIVALSVIKSLINYMINVVVLTVIAKVAFIRLHRDVNEGNTTF